MRLSKDEITIIKRVILKYIEDAKIFLFGSRVDDNKRGGDIDIFVQTDKIISLKNQLKILTEIEMNGIERKVDLLLEMPNIRDRKIFQTAIKEGIILW